MTNLHLLAGRFGAAVRLSPKALRLYARQGLLVPAFIDKATGYRYYAAGQISRARLIARLRQLGLPLARIAAVVDLDPEARLIELRAWLRDESACLADRTELVEALARQTKGGEPELMAEIRLRTVSASKIVYRQQAVTVDGLDDFLARADADIRAHLRDGGRRTASPLRLYFHEEVSRDGEGLVEAAICYEGILEPKGDLRLRHAEAHREAYLPVPAANAEFPLVIRIYDALEAWLAQRADLAILGSPCEVYPGSSGARFDVAYPINL